MQPFLASSGSCIWTARDIEVASFDVAADSLNAMHRCGIRNAFSWTHRREHQYGSDSFSCQSLDFVP